MPSKNHSPAFTLVELLMIVAIVVVLITFILIKFDPLQRKGEAYDAERTIHERQIYKAINDYLWDQNYPTEAFPTEDNPKWICPRDLTGTDCTETPVNGGARGVDLSFLVTDGYINEVPKDPVYAHEQSTGFKLIKDGDYYKAIAPYKTIYHPPPDPIAWWKLDETSIGTVAEEMNGYDGTHINMDVSNPTVDLPSTNLINNRSLNFNGANQYIEILHDNDLNMVDTMSITGWIKGDAWGAGSNTDIILRKGNECNVTWELAITDKKTTLILDGCEAGSNSYEGATELDVDTWYHIAATWDGANVNVYVNGVLDGGSFAHANPIGIDSRNLYIGGRREPEGGGGTADTFDGILDDIRLYDVVLTPEQIGWLSEGLF